LPLAVAAAALLAGPAAAAQKPAAAPWRQLTLTEAQRTQLKGIQDQHAKDAQAVRERLRAARRQLADAMRPDIPDEAAVKAAAQAVAAAQTEQSVLQARLKAQRMKVLTPEQLQQLTDARARAAERQARASERRARAADRQDRALGRRARPAAPWRGRR